MLNPRNACRNKKWGQDLIAFTTLLLSLLSVLGQDQAGTVEMLVKPGFNSTGSFAVARNGEIWLPTRDFGTGGVVRLRADGTVAGRIRLDINGSNSHILALTDSNFLVTGGFRGSDERLIRLAEDGTQLNQIQPNGQIWNMLQQPDGKVLLVGEFTSVAGTPINRIARINPDLSFDPSFNPGIGIVTGQFPRIESVSIQNQTNILIGGYFSYYGFLPRRYLARSLPNGTLDIRFDPGTILPESLLIFPDSPLIPFVTVAGPLLYVAIGASSGEFPEYHLFRLDSEGKPDPSFNYPYPGEPYALKTQPDGKIIITGFSIHYDPAKPPAAIVRFLENGNVDSSFLPFGTDITSGYGLNMEILPSGKVIVAGPQFVVRLSGDPVAGASKFGMNCALNKTDLTLNTCGEVPPNSRVIIEFSEDLETWKVVPTQSPGQDETRALTTSVTACSKRFYRAVLVAK
jgi:uncharacterized delta-60 repeat protein